MLSTIATTLFHLESKTRRGLDYVYQNAREPTNAITAAAITWTTVTVLPAASLPAGVPGEAGGVMVPGGAAVAFIVTF